MPLLLDELAPLEELATSELIILAPPPPFKLLAELTTPEPVPVLSLKLAYGVPLRLADGRCGACADGAAVAMVIAEHARRASRHDGHRLVRRAPTA